MKKCSYCGKQFADDLAVCPVDGQPAAGWREEQRAPASSSANGQNAFDLILISPVSSAGKYRVFAERNDLVFIYVGGAAQHVLAAVAPLLGPLGEFIPLGLRLFDRYQSEAKLKRTEESSPDDLLRESAKSFKLSLAEIRDAVVAGPKLFAYRGKAGRLTLTVRHGERIEGEFENAAEMGKTIRLLTLRLNSTLQIGVQWNEEQRRFEPRKKNLTP